MTIHGLFRYSPQLKPFQGKSKRLRNGRHFFTLGVWSPGFSRLDMPDSLRVEVSGISRRVERYRLKPGLHTPILHTSQTTLRWQSSHSATSETCKPGAAAVYLVEIAL